MSEYLKLVKDICKHINSNKIRNIGQHLDTNYVLYTFSYNINIAVKRCDAFRLYRYELCLNFEDKKADKWLYPMSLKELYYTRKIYKHMDKLSKYISKGSAKQYEDNLRKKQDDLIKKALKDDNDD